MESRKWIPKKLKKGALSRQLGIPEEDNIPLTLLQKIKHAKPGTTIKNPTKSGKKKVKVTPLVKKRSITAITLKKITKRRKKQRRERNNVLKCPH